MFEKAPGIPYSRADVRDALADYLVFRSGRTVEDPHPLAEPLAHQAGGFTMLDVVRHITGLNPGDQITTRSLGESDFADSLAAAVSRVVSVAFTSAANEHSRLVLDVTSSGTKPVSLPEFSLGEIEALTGDIPQMQLASVQTGAEVVPTIFSGRFLIPRSLVLNDQAGVIVAASRQLGAMAARIEAKLVANLLDANPTMPDGDTLFSTGNTTSSIGLSASTLGAAVGLLRTQETAAGELVNAEAKVLLVPPTELGAAWILAEAVGNRVEVVSNAWLSGSSAFVFADPEQAATLVRARPRGFERPDITQTASTSVQEDGSRVAYDGLGMRLEHVTGIGAVSRAGCVRIPLS